LQSPSGAAIILLGLFVKAAGFCKASDVSPF